MAIPRRVLLIVLLGLAATPALAHPGLHRHPHGPRRRIRRRVLWRTVGGRRVLVVPTALAVGWELAVDDRVVVVREIHEHKIVVEDPDGSSESIGIVREDTEENAVELEGSEYEVEVEEEVE